MRRHQFSWMLAVALLGGCDSAITEPIESGSRPEDAPALLLVLDPTVATIRAGETLQINATAVSPNRAVVERVVASWSSSDETIATVGPSGAVRALRPGLAFITVRWNNSLGVARIAVLKAESDPRDI